MMLEIDSLEEDLDGLHERRVVSVTIMSIAESEGAHSTPGPRARLSDSFVPRRLAPLALLLGHVVVEREVLEVVVEVERARVLRGGAEI